VIKIRVDSGFKSLHDFLLAKQIVDKRLDIAKERNLSDIKSVTLEIGSIALGHDNIPEHTEEISIENLEFGIKSLTKGTILDEANFVIKRAEGSDWKIINIEAD
jgi:Zn finger protein HypA/HybF involved in hydrogenase expression